MSPDELRDKAMRTTCLKRGYGCALSLPAFEAANDVDRLRDALSGLVDWCSEGCPEGGAYAITEARAALANIKLVRPEGQAR